ncbi:MAG: hypothetical protein ABJB33_04370 [Gemmatimonadota bacterium]
MSAEGGATLETLARRWNRRWSIAAAALGLSIATCGLALRLPPLYALLIGLGAGVLLIRRRPRVDATLIARHFDRTFPALEESTALLLVPPSGLSAMERAQQARAASAFTLLPATLKLPGRPIRLLWILSGACIVVALSVSFSAARVGEPSIGRTVPFAAAEPPVLSGIRLSVTAPAYLGGSTRHSEGDADAFEGSHLTIAAQITGARAAWLVTTNGDSFPLTKDRSARLVAERSFLYQVVMTRDSFRVLSEWHRVTVLPDRAPMLTVVRPEERTLLPPAPPWRVPVEILVSDDHGVVDAHLLATITTGSGEGVRFREDTLTFAVRESRGTGLLLRTELDLAALGMGPGDELYLSAQAFDGRRPDPNEGRSTTLFISIADTAHVVEAEFDGLAIDRMPDYFRSQRQIIIDTEKLLADRARLTEAEFRRRSNDIGIDQQLLRLRYSEVAGEESSAEGEPMSGREHAAEEPADPNAAAVADPNAKAPTDLTAGEGHSHDIAENATLLARSTKELLQLALGEMWQAELQLRTYRPDPALPIEHRALEYLEAVRQSARSYVKRVGLDPPPLEPDRKRLTGMLDDIRNARSDLRVEASDTLPAIRAVLAGQEDRATFERASRELAQLAAAGPGRHLATLRELRAVQEGIERGARCAACALRLRAGLLSALPRPDPPAAGATPIPPVASRYFDRMRRP